LIKGRLDLQNISRQILKASDVEAGDIINHPYHPQAKRNQLADSDVSSLASLDHFFHFLPGRIRIFGEIKVNFSLIIFKRYRPSRRKSGIRKEENIQQEFTNE
jgi:hypothetical protein